MLLLAFGFFMGFQIREHVVWVPALLAVWVPAGQFIRLALDPASGSLIGDGVVSLAAFVPAAMGTAMGWGVRKVARPQSSFS